MGKEIAARLSRKALPLWVVLFLCGKTKREALGYNKTGFPIFYLHEGKLCTYQGRQDFGDGDGALFLHSEVQQRFYRSRFSKDTQEFGLGLPLAKAVIEEHNGTIEDDSEFLNSYRIVV